MNTIPQPQPQPAPRQGDRASLTPSEMVVIHGERFAPPDGAMTVGEPLLTSDAKVAVAPLAHAALAAAVLANEAAGVLRLRTERRSALFGLIKRTVLLAEAAAAAPEWPAETLEARIAGHLAGGTLEVQEVLYRALETDSANASQHTIAMIKQALFRRGVLEQEEKKHLKVISTSRFRLAPAAVALVAQHPPEPVQRLLDGCRHERPEPWKALDAQIAHTLVRRRESDGGQSWSD